MPVCPMYTPSFPYTEQNHTMQLRTITVGAREADLPQAARAATFARAALEAAGYTVQTLRLALLQVSNTCADFPTVAQGAERLSLDAGFDYVSVGPVDSRRLPGLAEALATTETVFASTHIAATDGTVFNETIRVAAEAMLSVAHATPLGFGNLRFAALAGVGPGTPFFPASYHDTGAPWLAVGPEASALAVQATAGDGPALPRLTALIEGHDARIAAALAGLADATGVAFSGCDWSLAPHPDSERSIGRAIEALSGVPFGAWGTLAAVRGLTAAVKAARVRHLGFSGVMLPVLEDAVLAQRNTEQRYTLRDLLAFSAVCGTGLDTIPLPGDVAAGTVAGVLLEIATLSSALRKPLTVRLLPIPGATANAITTFDFPYFVNTRVMNER